MELTHVDLDDGIRKIDVKGRMDVEGASAIDLPGAERRRFAADIGEPRPMSAWLRRIADGAHLDPDVAWKAELCLNEAAANIIAHGRSDAPQPIEIAVEATDRSLRLTLIDEGQAFNPLDAPPPPAPHSIEDVRVGGLGIPILRIYATQLAYHREHDRNVLVLAFER